MGRAGGLLVGALVVTSLVGCQPDRSRPVAPIPSHGTEDLGIVVDVARARHPVSAHLVQQTRMLVLPWQGCSTAQTAAVRSTGPHRLVIAMTKPPACYSLAMTWVYTIKLPAEVDVRHPVTLAVSDPQLGRRSPRLLVVT